MTIQEAIKALAATNSEQYCKLCTVDSVDIVARTVDCTPIDGSAPLLSVNLQANQTGEHGVVVFPTVGSHVLVGFTSASTAAVLLCEAIDKVTFKVGETVAQIEDGVIDLTVSNVTVKIDRNNIIINGGGLGGLVKVGALTEKINALIDTLNSHTHTLEAGAIAVTGSATSQSNPTPVTIPAIAVKHNNVVASDYENKKIQQ